MRSGLMKTMRQSKTYEQWMAEKQTERRAERKERKEKKTEEKDGKSRTITNSEVYEEWLRKKHLLELENESKRIIEMRSKWAAKGVFFASSFGEVESRSTS